MNPDNHQRLDLDFSKIQFNKEIQSSDASSIFEIDLDGQKYALKVYHDNGDSGYAENGRDLNRFRCELNAYQNLYKAGVCQRGLVPFFHGYMDRVDPATAHPALERFAKDKFHPQVILLEYLPNAESLNCVNFSEALYPQATEAIKEIHKAHVIHRDVYPRNILLVRGDPDRLVWIDFDVATTFTDSSPKVLASCDWEYKVVASFGDLLKQDQAEGLPPNTKFY